MKLLNLTGLLIAASVGLASCTHMHEESVAEHKPSCNDQAAHSADRSPVLFIDGETITFVKPERLVSKGSVTLDMLKNELLELRSEEWTTGCAVVVNTPGMPNREQFEKFKRQLKDISNLTNDLGIEVISIG